MNKNIIIIINYATITTNPITVNIIIVKNVKKEENFINEVILLEQII